MDFNELHKRNLLGYERQVNQAYSVLIRRVAELLVRRKITDALFSFGSDKKLYSKVDKLLDAYRSSILETLTLGITKEWNFANTKNDALRQGVVDRLKDKLPPEKFDQIKDIRSPRNLDALDAYQKRKTKQFEISERVWNLKGNTRTELEFAVDLGLSKGMSAAEIAKSIEKHLNEPDKMFRRVRDKHGNLVASKAMKDYKSGRGVYKSSKANAMRFVTNEINIAYKKSDLLRIGQNKDVVGYEVKLSPQHKVYDMCDELKGKYPKSFIFLGWHVLCKCYIVSILKTEEELISEIMRGVEGSPKKSENYVGDVPDNFKNWVSENRERIQKMRVRPNFITDNYRYGKIVHGLKPMN